MEVTCARNIIVGIWDYLLPHKGFKVEHVQVGDHSAFGDQASTLKNLSMSSSMNISSTHKEIHLAPDHRRRSALGTHTLVTCSSLHEATYHKLRGNISSRFTRGSRKI